jgi:hypothetical protein
MAHKERMDENTRNRKSHATVPLRLFSFVHVFVVAAYMHNTCGTDNGWIDTLFLKL